jgi:hypothetical protein
MMYERPRASLPIAAGRTHANTFTGETVNDQGYHCLHPLFP